MISTSMTAGCGGGRKPPPEPTGPLPLFISPHGEAFRATPGGLSAFDQWFKQADRDGDGRISRAEFAADAQDFFAKADLDQDGSIVPFEVSELQTKYARETLGMYGPPPERPKAGEEGAHRQPPGGMNPNGMGGPAPRERPQQPAPRTQGAARFGLLSEPEPIMTADTDFNRRVTPAEMAAAADQRFTKLDKNADGFFTRAEAPERITGTPAK